MNAKPVSFTERTPFLSGVTFLGGFLNSYTYVTRGGVLANNHTGNMSKLGINLAMGNWSGALGCILPILACVLGAATSEVVKSRASKKYDWRVTALLAMALALAAVAFVPTSVPDAAVNAVLSYVTGFQLCLFRTSQWGAHNTTICTGNLRSVGQYLFGAVHERTAAAWSRFAKYTALVFTFTLGSFVGVFISNALGTFASLAGSAIAVVLLSLMVADSRRSAPRN